MEKRIGRGPDACAGRRPHREHRDALDEAELNGNIVFVYRAGHSGTTTVAYALTKDEGPKALKARFFKVVVF